MSMRQKFATPLRNWKIWKTLWKITPKKSRRRMIAWWRVGLRTRMAKLKSLTNLSLSCSRKSNHNELKVALSTRKCRISQRAYKRATMTRLSLLKKSPACGLKSRSRTVTWLSKSNPLTNSRGSCSNANRHWLMWASQIWPKKHCCLRLS